MKRASIAFAVILAWLSGAATATADIAVGQVWKNQRGSTLTITTLDANGGFRGDYVNNAAGYSCQGTVYPAVGWVNGQAVGWTVLWSNAGEDCDSVSAWSGVLLSEDRIEAFWTLGVSESDFGPRVWVGTDNFERQ